MATKTATTAKAAPTVTIDERVKALFDEVRKEKAAIGKAEKPNWKTNGTFSYSPNSAHDRVSIQVETDVRKLNDILAFLIGKKRDSTEAAEILGNPKKFRWMNFSYKSWENDLVTRASILQLAERKAGLASQEARLAQLLSPEQKIQLELDAIEAERNKSKAKDDEDDEN